MLSEKISFFLKKTYKFDLVVIFDENLRNRFVKSSVRKNYYQEVSSKTQLKKDVVSNYQTANLVNLNETNDLTHLLSSKQKQDNRATKPHALVSPHIENCNSSENINLRKPWECYRVISGHLGWVRSIAFDPTNQWFCTGSSDRTIKIWDVNTGELKLTLTGHIEQVTGLSVSRNYPYLFSCGLDKMVSAGILNTIRLFEVIMDTCQVYIV